MWRFLYIITLIVMLDIWASSCLYFVRAKSHKVFQKTWLINLLFSLLAFACHIIHLVLLYFDVGFDDWNFQNAMPYANVSPLLFTITPIFLILPKEVKKYCLNLISLLSIGMLLSPVVSVIHNIVINYKFHASFLLDYFPHILLSIWGVYIIQSKQIELKIKPSLISGSIIVIVAVVMLILNVILDKSFFGLSLNGKHSIYNQKIVSNSYLSAALYFMGLIALLVAGYLFQKSLNYLKKKHSL